MRRCLSAPICAAVCCPFSCPSHPEIGIHVLTAEIITARHPDQEPSLVLELPEQAVHSAGLEKLAQEKAGYHLAKPPAGSHPSL
jgi:hypothetical protein